MADLQQAVFRLAKSIEGRAGRRGRSPLVIEELTKLFAVGIEAGSAVLEIQAPSLAGQLPLTDVGLDALSLLEDTLETLARGGVVNPRVDDWSREGIGAFLAGLSSYEGISLEDRRGDSSRRVEFRPAAAAEALRKTKSPSEMKDTLAGKLYELNIKTGTYRIEDDLGRSHLLEFDTPIDSLDHVRPLIGRTVVATGVSSLEPGIRPRFRARSLELADALPRADFFDFDLPRAIEQTHPIESLAALRIDEFGEEESLIFWKAITE